MMVRQVQVNKSELLSLACNSDIYSNPATAIWHCVCLFEVAYERMLLTFHG